LGFFLGRPSLVVAQFKKRALRIVHEANSTNLRTFSRWRRSAPISLMLLALRRIGHVDASSWLIAPVARSMQQLAAQSV
jgi:hypothetical protein